MINEELSELFGYDYSVLKDYIDNWQPVEELAWLNQFSDRRFIREIKDEEREYFDRGWKELREAKPDLKISYRDFVDNKIEVGGQKRKLFKYINDKDLSELVGKYKLPKTKLYLVISTNFDDFLMCSTKNPWTACTDLTSGDFKFTTLGNIFTKGRFIAYVTDLTQKEFMGLESYKMFYRCFGFINQNNEMVGNLWYPIKEYMSFPNEHFKSVTEVENKISKYGFDKIFNNFDFFVYPYLDYSLFTKDDKFEFLDSYFRFHPIIEYKNGETKSYSSRIMYSENGLEESLWRFCDCCKTKKGNIITFGKKNYCPECFKKETIVCEHCGKTIKASETLFTEDNKFICNDCKTIIYKRSDVKQCNCGTLIKKKGEENCKFCRSLEVDAFKNTYYDYLGKNGNLYTYFKHIYVKDEDVLPPGIKYDEEVYENKEIYVER